MDAKIIESAKEAVIKHDMDKAIELTNSSIADGVNPLELMNDAFIPAINAVGDLFGRGQLFLPELVQAADVMKAVTALINDALPDKADEKAGTILIATVKGDVHDIGKGIVVSMLNANGFTVHDLGRDVATELIVDKAIELDVDVIGTSALLTTTMGCQKDLEKILKDKGVRDKFKTIVGGAPVTVRWADKIGADAYAEDAQDAVVKIKALLGK
ncbi:MAG: corrinoid protein [Desulfobacterales bacterium]|nr:corrinoid protein [Desulfobacterales bacterium]